MQIRRFPSITPLLRATLVCLLLAVISLFITAQAKALDDAQSEDGRLITFHDRGEKRVILSRAGTVGEALKAANIMISPNDVVEPKQDSKLIASSYSVNIYRARPVIVVDGMVRQKVMTAAQAAKDIVAAAGGELRDEDTVATTVNQNIVADGAGVLFTIDRATGFTLKLYGKSMPAYSQGKTVGEMLQQKGIKLAANDTVTTPLDAPLAEGMTVEIWREGVQTTTIEEDVDFPVRTVLNADRPIGFREIQTPGVKGKKDVVYEITATGGKETGRKAIQSVVTKQPTEEIVVLGADTSKGLTKSKGAIQVKDSRGVLHRETYYDLPMNVVMRACGGGSYTVRFDGAKVDKDGYVLVAAHLGRYPRCSLVETSIGLGKVYDTGGFVNKYPDGFDLATDWSNGDGR